jgi:hypothetical protein
MVEAGVVLAVAVLACVLGARADGSDHKYKEGDHVPLYANKVGPFHNPRYNTYSCRVQNLDVGSSLSHKFQF